MAISIVSSQSSSYLRNKFYVIIFLEITLKNKVVPNPEEFIPIRGKRTP